MRVATWFPLIFSLQTLWDTDNRGGGDGGDGGEGGEIVLMCLSNPYYVLCGDIENRVALTSYKQVRGD